MCLLLLFVIAVVTVVAVVVPLSLVSVAAAFHSFPLSFSVPFIPSFNSDILFF